jgi:hypothetical protein
VSPLYGAMFGIGGAALEAWLPNRIVPILYLSASMAVSALVAPLALPILPPVKLVAYMRALRIAPKPQETLRQSALPQTFADMHGWREMTDRMTEAVRMLPPDEQRRVVILAHNYGEAGAFEFYGRGLPPVLAGHNQYYLWGLRGTAPDELITFNRDEAQLKTHCRETRELSHFDAPWVMPFEDDSPITLCRGIHPSLAEMWPQLKLLF